MTTDFKEYFVGERAKALAQVLLTRRSDLVVEENRADSGFDFLVYIRKDGLWAERRFGVFLQAAMTPVTIEQANAQLEPAMKSFRRREPFAFPACVFYFTAKNDKGYFAWVCEPQVAADGALKLKTRSEASCRELTPEVLDDVVASVDKWYDALLATLAV